MSRPDPERLPAMRAEMLDHGATGAAAILQGLIGCSWGRSIATPDDRDPCPAQATRISILHDGPREYEVRLCPHHHLVMLAETDPHHA